jgi:hypothetical protein
MRARPLGVVLESMRSGPSAHRSAGPGLAAAPELALFMDAKLDVSKVA